MKIEFNSVDGRKISFHAYDNFPKVRIINIETEDGGFDEILLSEKQVKLLRDFLSYDGSEG